jgi:ketopantoate hydroxymethyltransferase
MANGIVSIYWRRLAARCCGAISPTTPGESVHTLGGYRVQGKGDAAAETLLVKNFLAEAGSPKGAIEAYVKAVKDRRFPDQQHAF